MLSKSILITALVAESALAFPFVADVSGVDNSLWKHKRQQVPEGAGSEANCPFNPVHPGAAPISAQYPYNNAKNGAPGNGKGGFLVPAKGDTAHQYTPPDYTKDIRGPCPGLNAMANHNFLSHDGIVTFNELVDAQQNVYNVGYDLAVLLAVLGLTTTDGDVVTEKLSLGCDATKRTSFNPLLTGQEPGLAGHNKFEADTSLTRNDFWLDANRNNFYPNATLFDMMTKTTGGVYNRDNLAKYRYQRYIQSRAENKNFYFGPFSLLLFGASSFLYELMPSGTRNYAPDVYTISSFFGMTKNANGEWEFTKNERIPDNWTNRVEPYTIPLVGNEIFAQYAEYPVLFGGNTGDGQFDVVSGPNGLESGKLTAPDATSVSCLLYMLATERIPSGLNAILSPTIDALNFATSKLAPQFKNLGCPGALTK